MKNKIFILVLLLLSFSGIAGAGEVTGAGLIRKILVQNGYDLNRLLRSGRTIFAWDSTRARQKTPRLSQIELFVTKNRVISMDDVESINTNGGEVDLNSLPYYRVDQMTDVEAFNHLFDKKDFKGFVTNALPVNGR